MFALGQQIIYGSEGVFFVAEYTSSPVDKNDKRPFYVLKPVYGPEGNVIYTPVDNERVPMRVVMTREEAIDFVERMAMIECVLVEVEKNRRECYRSAIYDLKAEGCVSILKTVQIRRENCIKQKRRLAETDAEYEKKAKACLYGEIASALDMPFGEVEKFLADKM